jgi:hypothetical protein
METGVDVWVWLILLGSTLPVALARSSSRYPPALPGDTCWAWRDMDKERFLDEVTRQLRIIFDAIREGHKPPEVL